MRCFSFLMLLFSTSVWSNTLIISQMTGDELSSSIQSSWLRCAEQSWCLNELFYYRESFVAEAKITDSLLEVELLAEYSSHLLTQVQLYLRQDGFQLIRAEIEGITFDVASIVEEASTEEADRALVLFLNRHSDSAPRTLMWQTTLWDASLFSDGELLMLTFSQREKL